VPIDAVGQHRLKPFGLQTLSNPAHPFGLFHRFQITVEDGMKAGHIEFLHPLFVILIRGVQNSLGKMIH
jgi:hypothetical protein